MDNKDKKKFLKDLVEDIEDSVDPMKLYIDNQKNAKGSAIKLVKALQWLQENLTKEQFQAVSKNIVSSHLLAHKQGLGDMGLYLWSQLLEKDINSGAKVILAHLLANAGQEFESEASE